jgi:hypothetical protein
MAVRIDETWRKGEPPSIEHFLSRYWLEIPNLQNAGAFNPE